MSHHASRKKITTKTTKLGFYEKKIKIILIANKSRFKYRICILSKCPNHSDLGKIYFYDSLYMAAQACPPPLNVIAVTLCQHCKMTATFFHLLTNMTFLVYFNQSHMVHFKVCLCFIAFQI